MTETQNILKGHFENLRRNIPYRSDYAYQYSSIIPEISQLYPESSNYHERT